MINGETLAGYRVTAGTAEATRPATCTDGPSGDSDVVHIAGWWQVFRDFVLHRTPWSLCGVLLSCELECRCPRPEAPPCPICAMLAGWE